MTEGKVLQVQDIETPLEPPENFSFPFPFPPYTIQRDFMRALFATIDSRKLGIFESPTGSGKSLSLLCGSLTWLEKRENQRIEDLKKLVDNYDLEAEEAKAKNSQNWLTELYKFNKEKEIILKCKRELKFYEDLFQKREKIMQRRTELGRHHNRLLASLSNNKTSADDQVKEVKEGDEDDLLLNDEFAPDDFDPDDSDNEDVDSGKVEEFYPIKMIFASRTHSQISQFINELKRTEFSKKVTSVCLSSRQNLCINPEVSNLKNLSLINERCLDLQKGSKSKSNEVKKIDGKKLKKSDCSSGGCQYFKQGPIEELKNHIMSEPMDIEDLAKVSKNVYKACPYYASRKASKEAQLVLLPYNTLIHTGTREAVGIELQNSVLLLDEAHNLIESISNMYSTQISQRQLEACSVGLKIYMDRYRSRFTPSNLLKLKQLTFILKKLLTYISKSNETRVFSSISEFKAEVGIDDLDLYDLLKYFQKSKLIFKLKGYLYKCERDAEENSKKQQELDSKKQDKKKLNSLGKTKNKVVVDDKTQKKQQERNTTFKAASSQSVLNFAEFLRSFTTTYNSEGKIFYVEENNNKVFKFLLIGANKYFKELVEKTRSIILAGGTMKPYEDIELELFGGAKERITHFSCDHIIPDENLICIPLSTGPSGLKFDFTFQNRDSPEIMKELSNSILNLSRIVTGGIVVFLPSYDYENKFYHELKSNGTLDKIESKKKLFRESKGKSHDSESVLKEYAKQIKMNKNAGALLLAVVGGKLSEGINFSDELGRCVIVVGVPYPNIKSVEIEQKMNHFMSKHKKERDSFLNNLSSKAVNQSIGRAIRHPKDYAAIVLIDHRYSTTTQEELLPNWIRKRYIRPNNFGSAIGHIAKFFAEKKTQLSLAS